MSNSKKLKKIRKIIPGFIRHDFLRKFTALFFAILVWQRVNTQIAESEILHDIPVTVLLPENLVRTNDTPIKVSLKVKASRRILNNLSINDIQINVKLSEPTVDKNPMRISHRIAPVSDITLPSGINIIQVKPEIISINVDRKISKTVPVKLTSSGFLMSGYSYQIVALIPDSVIITGPQSIIRKMKEIKTEPVILKKENVEDFECSVDLVLKDNVTASRKAITAQIEIYKKYDVREFSNILIKPFGVPASPAKVVLNPDKTFIIIDGAKKAVEIMNASKLHPFVDISGLKVPGKYSLNVECWLEKKDVDIKEIKPSMIEVELKKP